MVEQLISKHNNIDTVFSSNKKIILTFITGEYNLLLLNWYKHLEKIGIEKNVIVVCLDKTAYAYVTNLKIPSLLIDQNEVVKSDCEYVSLLKKMYVEKHHICKALFAGYFATKYNIDVIHSDIDMIFLKDPFERLENIIDNRYDMGAYMDLSYSELTYRIPKDKGGFGFVAFYIASTWFFKLMHHLKHNPLMLDDDNVGIDIVEKYYSDIKINRLNSFLFTNYSIWSVPEVYNNIKKICYCVHYNTSENTWACNMTENKIKNRNDIKIERMKHYGHWLL